MIECLVNTVVGASMLKLLKGTFLTARKRVRISMLAIRSLVDEDDNADNLEGENLVLG